MDGFRECFSSLADPVIALCTVLCGGLLGGHGGFCRKERGVSSGFLCFDNGLPSH
jgi:hypothetical protein